MQNKLTEGNENTSSQHIIHVKVAFSGRAGRELFSGLQSGDITY
jgi:hypothetical protein